MSVGDPIVGLGIDFFNIVLMYKILDRHCVCLLRCMKGKIVAGGCDLDPSAHALLGAIVQVTEPRLFSDQ